MVKATLTNVTSLTRNGLRDWLIQRVTSIIAGIYILILLGFFVVNPHPQFFEWQNFFSSLWIKVFSVLFLISMALHAWIGIWTVATDYLKPASLRLFIQALVIIALIVYCIWGIAILWSV